MVLRYRLMVLCCAAAALFGSCGQSGSIVGEKALRVDSVDYDHLSYALGVSAGIFLDRELGVVNMDEFIRGVNEGRSGESKLTEQDIHGLMQDYQTRKMQAEAAENTVKGKLFLDSVAQLPGVERDSSGLLYRIVEQGQGAYPADTSYVQVHYYGRFTDGSLLDSNRREQPALLSLQGVIRGWSIGLEKIREGGKIELYIPADLAYGANARPGVPANSTLIFDVELLRVLTSENAVELMQPR